MNRTSSTNNNSNVNSYSNKVSQDSLLLSSIVHEYDESNIRKDREWMKNKFNKTVIMDTSGEFYIIPFFSRANSLSRRDYARQDVSLVTQGSLSHLDHLDLMSKRWNGLISVALFVQVKEIPMAMDIIILLRKCFPLIRSTTSFHLVYPLKSPDKYPNLHIINPKSNKFWSSIVTESVTRCDHNNKITNSTSINNCCSNILSKLFTDIKSKSMNYFNVERIAYPNNLLRNVGRRYSLTEFILVIDIDMVTSINLRDSFLTFAKENKLFENTLKLDKVSYVVPVYEVHRDTRSQDIASDKNSLLDLISTGKARPFYIELCKKCQRPTEYESWEKEVMREKLSILYEVEWKDPWEPFYLSRNTAPMYDERFRQYGFNRISNLCELHIAGYRFAVLNNAFIIHIGLKKSHSFHSDKEIDQERNRHLFRQFKLGLSLKYPNSDRSC